MFAAVYDSNNNSSLMDISTVLYLEPVPEELYFTVQTVTADHEAVNSFTIPVDISSATYDLEVQVKCTVGDFDVLYGYLHAMKIA